MFSAVSQSVNAKQPPWSKSVQLDNDVQLQCAGAEEKCQTVGTRANKYKMGRRNHSEDTSVHNMSVEVNFFMLLRWAKLEAATGSRTGWHVLWFNAEYVAAIAP